jgi:PKHD-type hydroxylase
MRQDIKSVDWNNFQAKLFIKNNFVPENLCIEIREYAESNLNFSKVSMNSSILKGSYSTTIIPVESYLNSQLQNLLSPVWDEAANFYNFDIDFNEPYEVKKYKPNDFLSDHEDQFYGHGKTLERKLSMVIQLSRKHEYRQGDFRLLRRNNYIMDKTIGSVIIFPSFYLHEVTKVLSGIRYSINSWAWGPFWK